MKTMLMTLGFLVLSQASAAQVDCGKADWKQMANWAKQYRKTNGTTIRGRTTDNKPCELNVFDSSWYPGEDIFYISLGTSAGGTNPSDFSYIGTFINPDSTMNGVCTIKELEVTPQSVHIHLVQEEAGVVGTVENDLLVRLNPQGFVSQASGSSTHWPSSTCLFQ